MKYYSLLIALLFGSLIGSNAQTTSVEDDFEGDGTIDTWFGDDCTINTAFSNPFQQGVNTSDKVLEYRDMGAPYANVRFDVNHNFNLSSGHTFSLKIYVPSGGLSGSQPNQVSLKLQDGNLGTPWSTQTEIVKPITLDQWQIVTFDFANDSYINLDGNSPPPVQRTDLDRVVIQVNGENNTNQVLAYLDDFEYDGTLPADPGDPVFDHLVWSDEFDESGAVDPVKWFHQTQLPEGGNWYNGEVQHYTDRLSNSFVEDGALKIVAQKESFADQGYTKQYTSARLNSKFAFTYGKVEVRAKLPSGIGTWPAIWMLGKNINEDGAYWDNQGFDTTPWPACGEIDIMEHWGDNQNYVQSATHTPSSFGGTVNHGGQTVTTASTAFHTYTLEWTTDHLKFSVDGAEHYTYDPVVKNADTWPFDKEQYLLLNIAIQPSISSAFTSGAMEIDYVRVYQEAPVMTNVFEEKVARIAVYPNPFTDELMIRWKQGEEEVINVSLFSLDGRLIDNYMSSGNDDQINFGNLDHLTKGMYLVHISTGREVYSLKVVKD